MRVLDCYLKDQKHLRYLRFAIVGISLLLLVATFVPILTVLLELKDNFWTGDNASAT